MRSLSLSLCFIPVALFLHSVVTFGEGPLEILLLGPGTIEPPVENVTRANGLGETDLGEFDCVVLDPAAVVLSEPEIAALTEYVEAGGGLAVLRFAGGEGGPSEASGLRDLIGAIPTEGAAGGDSQARVIDAGHPVSTGVAGFGFDESPWGHKTRDETNRVLLAREREGAYEPLVWVRPYGKGRVFYTSLGTSAETWRTESFRTLIARGIEWAGGRLKKDYPPPPTEPANPPALLEEIPEPLSPEESMKRVALPEGFRLELFAAEPDVVKPVAIAWDERGRAWVVESTDYPNRPLPEGEGHDRIKILEDTDGDGAADKITVFAENLNIPTGIQVVRGGAIIAHAPDILFLEDTDGDDVADRRAVLYTGFGKFDTHAVASNLRYGFDNQIWATVGYSGATVRVGGATHTFGQGIFRFETDGSDLEYLTRTSNNTWGLGFNEEFEVFASTANNEHSVHFGVANRYYENVLGWTEPGSRGIEDHKDFHPLARIRQVDVFGGYTAACGHAVYTARAFPKEFWNRTAFVCEPTGHLVHVDFLVPDGSGFVARDGWNLFASEDEWTGPVAAEVGPDGAVWVLDWYNFIIRHNPTPAGFETGEGNAYVTGMRDKTRGRIYRVVFEGRETDPIPDLAEASTETLVSALSHDNLFWRLTAQRMLVEDKKTDAVPSLLELIEQHPDDSLHCLWALDGLGYGDRVVETALGSGVPALQRAALDLATRGIALGETILDAGLLENPDAIVRKKALLALAEIPPSDDIGRALVEVFGREENRKDRWIRHAAYAAAARHDRGFLDAVLEGRGVENDPSSAETAPDTNLLPNASFEKRDEDQPLRWSTVTYGGEAQFSITEDSRTGEYGVEIVSASGADAVWVAEARVERNTDYEFSGWIKTENVEKMGGAKGALFNAHTINGARTEAVLGDAYWTRVTMTFNSGARTKVAINCLLGGWGRAKGSARYDDVRLSKKVSADPLEEPLRIVSAHYAKRGPSESIVATLASLANAGTAQRESMLAGLADGWPKDTAPILSPSDRNSLGSLVSGLSAPEKIYFLRLVEKWDALDGFASAYEGTANALREIVGDIDAEDFDRVEAARNLVELADSEGTADLLLEQFSPQESPLLLEGFLAALARSREPGLGASLLDRWESLTPLARRPAIGLLLRRPGWTAALIDSLESGTVAASDLSTAQANRLMEHPKDPLADRARAALEKAGRRTPDADRQAKLDRLLPIAEKKGDLARGKKVFKENCMQCHQFQGEGASVGPDLAGVVENPRHDLLLEILDPNRSVEGNYRQWNVSTYDGDLLSGLLIEENKASIVLLAASDERHELDRTDIEEIRMSTKSVMPEGFDELPEDDLASLLEFLKSKKE